jgi:cation transport ATPase
VHAGLLPGDKVRLVERAGRAGTAYVGDGLNDAAVLAAAEVGITVAGSAPRSLEAAPVNVLRPGLAALPELLDLARAAVRVARGNLAWAFAYNAVGLWLAATGRLTPVFAASAMVASSVLVVLNSGRVRGAVPAPDREAQPPAASRRHERDGERDDQRADSRPTRVPGSPRSAPIESSKA